MNLLRVCVIPARGGSKRIPRKNVRSFCGYPMISWSIRAAIDANCFDRIIVSTDDDEIADVAISFGAEVPFLRPSHLSSDHATTQAVIVHALHWFDRQRLHVGDVCCLYATAPFVQSSDLVRAQQLLASLADDRFVFAATSYPYPVQRAFRINSAGVVQMLQPACFNSRSQDLEETYHDAGQFYLARPQGWLNVSNVFEAALPLLLPRWRVQDIDTEEDLIRAELMHRLLDQNGC
jgi:pseudaminic acid cytidylyltransferase